MMLADPSKKYRRMYQRVDLPDRQWPNKEINQEIGRASCRERV